MNNSSVRLKAIAFLFALCSAVAILGGCKSGESALAGTWNGPQGGALMLNADKTFSQGDAKEKATGTWSLADKKVTMKVEKIGTQSADDYIDQQAKAQPGLTPAIVAKLKASIKNAVFDLSEDGKTMSSHDAGPTGAKVTFTKAAK